MGAVGRPSFPPDAAYRAAVPAPRDGHAASRTAPVAQAFSRKLLEKGVFAMAIGYPTVPKGKARLRVMSSAAHSQNDLEQALAAFESVGKELGII